MTLLFIYFFTASACVISTAGIHPSAEGSTSHGRRADGVYGGAAGVSVPRPRPLPDPRPEAVSATTNGQISAIAGGLMLYFA